MAATASPLRSRWRLAALLLGSGLVLALLVGLGTWQVQRLHWKEALVATIAERVAAEPVDLAAIIRLHEQGEDFDYVPVSASGRFAHEHEQYFLATHRGASGWYVYTPLQTDAGAWLFVNRGFVPYDRRDPASRPEGQIEGKVAVTGLARAAPAEKPSVIVPDNDPAGRTYYWKDLAAMRQAAGLETVLPFFVDAGPSPNPGGLPIGGVTIIELPNNHLQYAVTWYGLAVALLGVLGFWLFGQRREGRT